MTTASSTVVYGGVFSVDGTRNLVCLTDDDSLVCAPMSHLPSILPPTYLVETLVHDVAGTTVIPLKDFAVISRSGPRSFAAHILALHDKDANLPRVHVRREFSLVGPYRHIPAPPLSCSTDEPSTGWLRVIKEGVTRLNGDPTKRAPVLVLVNPFSGTKKGMQIWATECAPILQEAGLRSNVVETSKAGNAYDIVKDMRLGAYSAVATVGGDGILNEVINGLMARDDWEQAIQTPIAPIAAGTGNATAYFMFNTLAPACVACHIVRNALKKSDIFLAAQPTLREYMWGILSCEYGIIAEADFGSERIRWLGSLRPSVWALYRILCGTFYRCRITYLPTTMPRQSWFGVKCTRDCKFCKNCLAHDDHIDATTTATATTATESQTETTPQVPLSASSTPLPSPAPASLSIASPTAAAADEEDQHQVVHRPVPKRTESQAAYGPSYTMSLTPAPDWVDDVPSSFAKLFGGFEHYHIGGPLPAGWTTHDNLNMCFCSFQKLPWLMPGMLVAPYAHQTDGCLDLAYATSENFSRATFAKFFGSFGEGAHVNHPKLSYLKVKSFTLEPLDQEGYVGVDGERLRYAPIQFYVAQGLMNLLCYC